MESIFAITVNGKLYHESYRRNGGKGLYYSLTDAKKGLKFIYKREEDKIEIVEYVPKGGE
jgi:Zn/Cd-binding protein ZinT